MSFLLAKISVLLFAAAALGAWLGRWWTLRHMEDVTRDYSTLRSQWNDWRTAFEERLARRPDVDLSSMHVRMDQIEGAVRGIRIPAPQPTDLTPVMAHLHDVSTRVSAIHVPPAPDLTPVKQNLALLSQAVAAIRIPAAPDLSGLHQQVTTLSQAVAAIRIPAAPDLSGLHQQVTALSQAVAAIRIPAAPDLSGLHQQVTALSQAVAAIRIPAAPDLSGLHQQLAAVSQTVSAIRVPVPKDVDLAPVQARLGQMELAIKGIHVPEPKTVDLSPMQHQLDDLEQTISAIRIPPPKDVDLTSVQTRLDSLEHAIRGIQIPPSQHVDLEPVLKKLSELESLRPQASPPQRAVGVPARAGVRQGHRNLLTYASYGPPDDLKLIKGVAEVLEGMLHGIGVYYFWQIAEWTPEDVARADAVLPAFHGRIARDHWVTQSIEFVRAGGVAVKPAELDDVGELAHASVAVAQPAQTESRAGG